MKAIVDCNSFYCSCERVFRPDLAKAPVVVLSNNDGCIISRSDEAKQFGVGMAGPYFKVKHLIKEHNISAFSSNYNLYGDLSWRVMETLRSLSDSVEVYSVDEAFLDLDGIPECDLEAFAVEIRNRVQQWTGISVSVGIAPTKTLAKIANHMAKKDKAATGCVKILSTALEVENALRQTRVTGIWGIGRKYADKLINLGITSAFELSKMREEWATRHLGGVVGTRLIRELNGIQCIEMNDPLESKKMIATTRMFGDAVNDLDSIREAVATYTSRAAEKLRRQHSAASLVSVFIVPREEDHMADFHRGNAVSSHTTLASATSLTHELIKPAVALAERMYESGRYYKKAGVMLGGLVPDHSIQANLFEASAKNSDRMLMSMLDNVNFSMRDDVLKFASSGTTRDWKMRQELRSKRYTSRWEELFEVG